MITSIRTTKRRLKESLPLVFFWILCIFFSGCGYRSFQGELSLQTKKIPIYIQYIHGDLEGSLTEALIQELALTGTFVIVPKEQASLLLTGNLLKDQYMQIGYQYDRHDLSGQLYQRLIPNEGRKEVEVEIQIHNVYKHRNLTQNFSADSEFDFVDPDTIHDLSFLDQNGSRVSALDFSLGQLDSIEGARASASVPAYHKLAKQITQFLLLQTIEDSENIVRSHE